MKIKTTLIGLGGVAARIHLPALARFPEVELVGAVEPSPQSVRLAGKAAPIPPLFATIPEMLEKTRPDVVVIGTPPAMHHEHARAALEAGAHVFLEKPFVSSVEEADDLIATARRAGRLLVVNNQYRYMTPYRETQRRLAAGEFGKAYQIQAWQQMFHPPSHEKNWRASLVQSTLYEFGTHALDLACFLFGALPAAVTARTPKVPQRIDADVLVVAMVDFPEDRVATFNFNRVSQAPERYLEMRLDAEEASIRLSLGGVARLSVDMVRNRRRPRLRASLVRGGEARVEKSGASRSIVASRQSEFASATAAHFGVFLEKIRTGAVEPSAALHAREVLRTVFAAYESARTRGTIRLDRAASERS